MSEILDVCLVAPTTPPTTAAIMIIARTIPKKSQKMPLRRPHILLALGSGGIPTESSMLFGFDIWGLNESMLDSVIADVGVDCGMSWAWIICFSFRYLV